MQLKFLFCTDSISISESYDLLDKISKTANEIINEIEKQQYEKKKEFIL